ncbi:hypothetical protein SDC9_127096 [bioreactor metagenome]|uniref:Uncharacterized protein n=1 Tax=bioreactor metagenome TaxID=1076179 RepID=A0A645CT27_9ZZZZ
MMLDLSLIITLFSDRFTNNGENLDLSPLSIISILKLSSNIIFEITYEEYIANISEGAEKRFSENIIVFLTVEKKTELPPMLKIEENSSPTDSNKSNGTCPTTYTELKTVSHTSNGIE